MKNRIITSLVLTSLTVSLFAPGVMLEAQARGFGGGGGGFSRGGFGGGGGGFDRGGFDRGGFDRGNFDRGNFDRGGMDRGGFDNGGFDRGGDTGIGRNNSIDSDPNRGVWTRPGGVDGGAGIDRGNFTSGTWNRPAGTGIGGAGHLDPVHNGGFGFDHISGNGNNVFRGGHNTYNYSPTYMNNRGLAVRNGFNGYDHFYGHGWYGRYPGCWYGAGWGTSTAWMITDWSMMAGMLAMSAVTPLLYGYGGGGGGGSVTYNNNNVYYNDQPVATADQYYSQAQTLATQGPTAPNYTSPMLTSGSGAVAPAVPADFNPKTSAKLDANAKKAEYKPLGVFSLVQGDQTNSTTMFQLAINAKGDIAGNYYDMLTDQDQQVHGHLDKKTQRVAFTVGKNTAVVYDCGLGNLMQEQAPILVHFDKSRTEQFLLVRLKHSDAQGQAGKS
ncbi:hypothetical protein KA183_17755 [bacterium]|nr:hypothetical protein [bacterium]